MKIHTYHNPLVLGWGCSVCKSEWVAVGAWGGSLLFGGGGWEERGVDGGFGEGPLEVSSML